MAHKWTDSCPLFSISDVWVDKVKQDYLQNGFIQINADFKALSMHKRLLTDET